MRRDQQIRINELLLQREELFLRIHAAESEATRLLGEPFPFTRPNLPSDRRGKRKPATTAPLGSTSAAGPAKPAPSLRKLSEQESAYRVTYRQFGQNRTEDHVEWAALATLLAAQTATLSVLRIETLDASGGVISRVFEADPAP
ncbi:MAG: hypothetical protein NTU80_14715 [Verrucomicrobia bacterium]|nr:hypothetical protein [Verrucomicrobiota bacterium]